METLEEILAEHAFFRGLPAADLQMIAGCGANVPFQDGQDLFREGDDANRFFLIRHGRVALEIGSPERGRVIVQTLGEGDVVGWSWLVPPYTMSCDARALGLTRATAFDGACIRQKCEADPRLGFELLKRFAHVSGQRLRATRLQLLDVYGSWG
jgi:CRP/FNR family transcriptional regulator, cyclic AMP receptor protein